LAHQHQAAGVIFILKENVMAAMAFHFLNQYFYENEGK